MRRTEDKETGYSPGWFDRYPMIYDQPDPDYRGRFSRPTREGLWWKHYNDVAAYIAGYEVLLS